MTTTETTAPTLSLTGAQWRALDTHRATERLRYAMEFAAWFPATDASRSWLGTDGVMVATDGKSAIFLPAPSTNAVRLCAVPKVARSKRALTEHVAATDASDDRHYPPALDVVPARSGDGLEIPTDSLRAIFAPFATDPDNDTVRCWFGLGIRLTTRTPLTDVSVSATWGNAPSDDCDPIGLGAAYVLAVCDAADLLGASLVTIRATTPYRGITFDLGGKGLAVVMPRVLS